MDSLTATLLGLAAGFAGWIGRGLLGGYLAKKGENLATKEDIEYITHQIEGVKSEYVQQIEQLRFQLQDTLQQRATLFARLHEQRADAVDTLYKQLVRTHDLFLPLAGSIKAEEDKEFQVKLDSAAESARELLQFFKEHRLYFDARVISAFQKIDDALTTAWVTFVFERRESDWRYLSPNDRKEQIALWRKARETIRAEIPVLLNELEREMRLLLGDPEGGKFALLSPDNDVPAIGTDGAPEAPAAPLDE